MTEDKMVGWHHQLNGHEFEQTPTDGEGQRSLVCCGPLVRKGPDTRLRLNKQNRTTTLRLNTGFHPFSNFRRPTLQILKTIF